MLDAAKHAKVSNSFPENPERQVEKEVMRSHFNSF